MVLPPNWVCPYCARARKLLDSKGVTYEDTDISMGGPKRAEMLERAHAVLPGGLAFRRLTEELIGSSLAPAITPEEAVSYAAALAQTHFQFFANFGPHAQSTVPAAGEFSADSERLLELFHKPIDELGLSVRSVNSLKNSEIRTLGDLVRQTEEQMLHVKNFGKKSLQEIADLLEREGLNFGMRYEETPEGVRITDWGTAPSRAAAAAPDDEEE